MRNSVASFAISFLLPAAVVAQETQRHAPPAARGTVPMRKDFEYLRPFRNPDTNLQPPLELYDELRQMAGIAQNPATPRSYDKDGREVCDTAAWREARARAEIKAARMGGYLAVVGQQSGSASDRALAYYGAYWLDSIQDTISIMALIPGEPAARVREEAMQRALAFLKVQLAKTLGGEGGARAPTPVDYAEGRTLGNKVYEDPNRPLYDFDLAPWCALIETDQPRAVAQALWFLRELMSARRQIGAESLSLIKHLLPPLLVHTDVDLRKEARAFVAAADPLGRAVPADGMPPQAVREWYESVLYEIFPPIRKVSSGLVDLYPSVDLEQIIATGRELLARDAIGSTASGTLNGIYYRGFRVQRAPKPLDKLGLPKDAVITHVNGVPVFDSKSLLDTLTEIAKTKRAFMVEFVANEQQKAIQYRLQ